MQALMKIIDKVMSGINKTSNASEQTNNFEGQKDIIKLYHRTVLLMQPITIQYMKLKVGKTC